MMIEYLLPITALLACAMLMVALWRINRLEKEKEVLELKNSELGMTGTHWYVKYQHLLNDTPTRDKKTGRFVSRDNGA